LNAFAPNATNDIALAAVWATIAWITFAWTAIADTVDVALAASRATDKKSNQLRSTTIIRKICTEDVMKKLKEIK
jgi:hypothetical protein